MNVHASPPPNVVDGVDSVRGRAAKLRQEAEYDSRMGRVNSSQSAHSYTYVLL